MQSRFDSANGVPAVKNRALEYTPTSVKRVAEQAWSFGPPGRRLTEAIALSVLAAASFFSAAAAADPIAGTGQADSLPECVRARQYVAAGRLPLAEAWARVCRSRGGTVVVPTTVAPATSSSSTFPANRAPGDWPGELPPADAVKQTVRGSDPADTMARQLATFAVLKDYIAFRQSPTSGLSGAGARPATAQLRLSEYEKASFKETAFQFLMGSSTNGATVSTDAIDRYADDLSFREETLARYISRPSVDAYLALVRTKAQAAQAQAAVSAEQTRRLATSSVTAANDANVDMTVFGIELGKPFAIPPCPTGANGPTADNCRLVGGLVQFATQFSVNGDFGVPGTVNVPVKLGASKCPDWVDCTVMVATKDAYVLSVSFLTVGNDSQDQIEARLTRKYRANPRKDTYSECHVSYGGVNLGTSERAINRVWSLPGLVVYYAPYGSMKNCQQGYIGVATTAYGDVLHKAAQQREDTQPKM